MKGCRALTRIEIRKTLKAFAGKYRLRDRALFLLQLHTGFRISEALSLRLSDVVGGGKMLERITVRRRSVKGKTEGRSVLFHPDAQRPMLAWLRKLRNLGYMTRDSFVFQSRARGNRPITVQRAWGVYLRAFNLAGVFGQVGTHSLRKTFAQDVYQALGQNLLMTQRALGHADPKSTVSYLSIDQAEIDAAILGMGGANRDEG